MTPLHCKATVRVKGFTPALLRILTAVYVVGQTITDPPEIVVTSINDSTHGPNSRHYTNEAVDIRSQSFPSLASKTRFATALRAELGPAFTVLFESAGTPNEHWHLQPKKGTTYHWPDPEERRA